MDLDAILELFAPNARVTYGKSPLMVGYDDIRAGVRQLYDRLQAVSHSFVHVWTVDDDLIVVADVTYHRTDGTSVMCPAATTIHFDDNDKIDEYRVFVDLSPLESVE